MRKVCPCCGMGVGKCLECGFTAEITRWKICPKKKHAVESAMRCIGCQRRISGDGRGVVQELDIANIRILPWRIVP